MLQALVSSTKSVELKRLVRRWRNRGKVCEEQSGDEVSDRQSARPTTRDRASQEMAEFLRARQACAVSGNANPTDLVLSVARLGWSVAQARCWVCHSDTRRPRVGRGEKTMAEKSSRNLHQSNSTSENAVKGIELPVTNSDCVLPEWFGCQVDSESIAPSWIVGCAAHVFSQSQKP